MQPRMVVQDGYEEMCEAEEVRVREGTPSRRVSGEQNAHKDGYPFPRGSQRDASSVGPYALVFPSISDFL